MDVLITILLLPFFLLSCLFIFLIPGHVLLSIIKDLKREQDDYIYSFAVGIAFALLVLYVSFWIGIPLLTPLLLIIVNIYAFLKVKSFSHLRLEHDKTSYIIIAVGSILFLGLVWFSGWNIGGYERYFGVNAEDGLIHYSRIKNMLHSFPPTHPGLSGVVFNGYHYFYDLLLSSYVMYFRFPISDLYFRFFPLLIAPFYGLSFLYLAKRITQDKVKIRLILLFAYFSSGFSSFLTILGTGFSANFAQPLALMVNPSFLLSISLLLIFIARLPYSTQKKNEWILIGLLIGVLSQLKVYAGLIAIVVLIIFSILQLIRYKKKVFLPLFGANVLAGVLTVVTFLPNNSGAGGLIFLPFVIYSHFMQQPLLSFLQWENKRLIFVEYNNLLRIFLLYMQAFLLYWFVTLGTRIILLFYAHRLLKPSFWKGDYNVILFIAISFPLFLASFFIQTISVFDTGQFFWIAVVFLSIPCGIVLGEIYINRKNIASSILLIFLLSTIALLYQEYSNAYWPNQAYTITDQENKVFKSISNTVKEDQTIVVLQERKYDDQGNKYLNTYPPVLISGKTGRNTYYESEENSFLLNNIYDKRTNLLFKLHESLDVCNQEEFSEIFELTNSPYLVTLFDSECLATHSALLEIASSDQFFFYKLKEK